MSALFITIFAYSIDRIFGEFRFMTHPIVHIGGLISFFEKYFYKDSILRGVFLLIFVLFITTSVSLIVLILLQELPMPLSILCISFLSSLFLAHHMLKEAVLAVLSAKDKRVQIAMLVSRDTENMSESDIYKAAVESYAENLSDGVIAPLFYLLFFGFTGLVFYKSVNTLDSMVGYRSKRYEKYGKASARLDDILNYIPSRITALLIMLLSKRKDIFSFYADGKKHDSPNAGHPITAMALALDIQLGGDTYYFGKLKKKASFGKGREKIKASDVTKALAIL